MRSVKKQIKQEESENILKSLRELREKNAEEAGYSVQKLAQQIIARAKKAKKKFGLTKN